MDRSRAAALRRVKYQNYKLKVKLWEKDFAKLHDRVPSKADIKDAPSDVRHAYKSYYRMKTAFLEETMQEALDEDGFSILDMSVNSSDDDAIGDMPQLPLDIAKIVAKPNATATEEVTSFSNVEKLSTASVANIVNLHEGHVVKSFEPVKQFALNETAWNDVRKQRRNMAAATAASAAAGGAYNKPQKLTLSQKLQKSSSFNLRNPRKSFPTTELLRPPASEDAVTALNAKEQLLDFESILLQKAQQHRKLTAIAANELLKADTLADNVKTQIDERWLARSTSTAADATQLAAKENVSNVLGDKHRNSYGLCNISRAALQSNGQTSENAVCAVVDAAPMETIKKTSKNAAAAVGYSDNKALLPSVSHAAKRRKLSDDVIAELANSDADDADEDIEPDDNAADNEDIESDDNAADNEDIEPDGKAADNEDIQPDDNAAAADDDEDDDEDDDDDEEEAFIASVVTKKTAAKKTINQKFSKMTTHPSKRTRYPRAAINSKTTEAKTKGKQQKSEKHDKVVTVYMQESESDAEDKMPDTDDLKYALILDGSNIIRAPRIDAETLQSVGNAAQKYINRIGTIRPMPKSKKAIFFEEKRAADIKKLEQRIAAGTLNDNYVTIDLQHKKYTRGKKSFNFSRYKKKQWKHKKHIYALTGPNMNMGGCDGGVITCHSCGQPGHFAQQCKVKGDDLLPLTAQLAEEPSPFPTLEEAEVMAKQNAVVAHSSNITKMPDASNPAIYRQTDATKSAETPAETVDNCSDTSSSSIEQDPLELNEQTDNMLMETDDELENMDLEQPIENQTSVQPYVGHQVPMDFLQKAGLDVQSLSAQLSGVNKLYDLNPDGSVPSVTAEVKEALRMFGHTDFRKGQDRAVMRILSGLSTLVTLSTGSGKSLCYQLPAYLFSRERKAITLVISPLVSLMEDQVTGVPHFLRAHCLHTNQTPQQKLKVMQLIDNGEVDILLVSPEAVMAGERSTGFGAILRKLPRIAFACIDEAHCVSQWSHNFRPSYLMICKVLRKNLGIHTILGLTATATKQTRQSIIEHLGIADGEKGIISDVPLPDNLVLSVSKDVQRDKALLELLYSKRFEACQSIIVYCTRREECERLAVFLRTCMQDQKSTVDTKKRKRVNWHAEPYHAGMPASRRRTIQNAFMNNELRIVVATIAFGMGINKPDIRAVIHYNMPRNFESYVQEIGRAGRDGKEAHCHLFLDSQGNDKSELRRHIYANSIDRHVIRKLLQRVFVPCCCATKAANTNGDLPVCEGHEVAFSKEKTVEALDIPAENIGTLLCYLELESKWGIKLGYDTYVTARVISYGGAKCLKQAAKECPALAMGIAIEMKKNKFKEEDSIVEFPVVEIAAAMGWHSSVVKNRLKNLEWAIINGRPLRTSLTVSFYDLGFRVTSCGNFTDDEIDDALNTLYERAVKQEQTQLMQLQYVFQGLSSVAYNTCVPCGSEAFSHQRSDQLKCIIRDYFQNDYPKDVQLDDEENNAEADDGILADINSLINMYPENSFSGRNVARIFHGISSPNYPAVMWGRCKYWRAHTKTDFNRIVNLANAFIVKRRN